MILLIPDEDGCCMTQGASREEALEMLDEAKTGWLIGALQDGDEIPEPEPFSARRS